MTVLALELPKIDSLWRHRNGNVYIIEEYSNKLDTDKYPLNVMHRNIHNAALYNRPASDWHRSMTQVERGEFIKEFTETPGSFIIQVPGVGAWLITPLTECKENAWQIAETVMIDFIKERLHGLRAKNL